MAPLVHFFSKQLWAGFELVNLKLEGNMVIKGKYYMIMAIVDLHKIDALLMHKDIGLKLQSIDQILKFNFQCELGPFSKHF